MQFGRVVLSLLGCMMAVAVAQTTGVPPGADPLTGARPGNVIGTGSSLPLSDKASNITPSDTRSVLAPNLPSPPIGENAPVRDYLVAARSALLADRTGETQQALEMAETRALSRSVPLFQTTSAVDDPLVANIEAALNALSVGDRTRCNELIQSMISRLDAGGPG